MSEINVTLNNGELATILAALTAVKNLRKRAGDSRTDEADIIRRLMVEKVTQLAAGKKAAFNLDEFFNSSK